MLKKYILITGALLFVFLLSACRNKVSQQDGNSTGGNSPTLGIPSDAPIITIIPDKHYKAEEGDAAVKVAEMGDPPKFSYVKISQDIKNRINGKSYSEDCDVPYDELRYVNVTYWGFDDKEHQGELIVNKAIAEDIVDIFKELYEKKYPIEKMVLVDEYDADDNASMAADNTSAFNYRPVDDGSSRLSVHSYGLAIDINPLYNPYVRKVNGETVVSPEEGAKYADRALDCRYYIKEGDACYTAFTQKGFTWGGSWKNQKDYQHFEKKLG